MIYCFGDFELDVGAAELRRGGREIPVERQVFLLLELLAKNGERLTSQTEIVDEIWNGAAISDAAIASRVRSARAALGDNGEKQSVIRTVRGRGYRLEPPVVTRMHLDRVGMPSAEGSAPSIAVLAFSAFGDMDRAKIIAPALAHELIVTLSLTRSLTVIARASSFQVADGKEAQERLDVDYVVTGSVEINANSVTVTPVMTSSKTGEVIWADRFHGKLDDIFLIKASVANSVVSAAEMHVPRHQAVQAKALNAEALDAWSFFHLGLNQIYRFTSEDNAKSAQYFQEALTRAPDFARAHAGLSFVAFQRAFTSFDEDRGAAALEALRFAERAMELAPDDPFSNFVFGRSYWMMHDLDTATHHLSQAVRLNPNYAQGHYSLGLVQALNGAISDGIDRTSELAMRLSPLDPLLYGMHGTKAWVRINRQDWAGAAEWADKSARTPGAHYLIDMMAAMAHGVCGNDAEARHFASRARSRRSDANQDQFFAAFPLPRGLARNTGRAALTNLGFGAIDEARGE